MSQSSPIAISFNQDQSLILFEMVILLGKAGELIPGEREVLNHMECALERELVEPFLPNYLELVAAAR